MWKETYDTQSTYKSMYKPFWWVKCVPVLLHQRLGSLVLVILQHWIKRWIRICHVGQRSETRYELESQNQNSFPLEKCLFVPKALSQTMTPWYSKTELARALEKEQQKRSHCTPLCLARHESRFRGVQSHFVAAKKLMHSSIFYLYDLICISCIISNNQICLCTYINVWFNDDESAHRSFLEYLNTYHPTNIPPVQRLQESHAVEPTKLGFTTRLGG